MDESALHPPANAPAISLRRSHDRSFSAAPEAEVRWLKPDGGIVFGELEYVGASARYTSSEALEPGAGYVLEVEEFCIDNRWNPDAGFVRTFDVEVTEPIDAPPSAPASIGTLTLSGPETVVEEVTSLESDCTATKEQVRFARVTAHFTPAPSWKDVLPRASFEVGGELGDQRFPIGTVGEEGLDVTFQKRCDQLNASSDATIQVLAEIPGMSPSPYGVASGTVHLECTPAPLGMGGCSATSGAASIVSAIGLGLFAFIVGGRRRRRGPH